MKTELRRGTYEELSKLLEQERLNDDVSGKGAAAVILRNEGNGIKAEVFNSNRGVNEATPEEIEFAIQQELDLGEKIGGSRKAREKRLKALQEALAAKRAVEEKKTVAPTAGDVSTALVAGVIDQLMRPLLESMGKLLKDNTEAMEHIAASQDVIRNRMEALEKQVRLQTPVTDRQARYLADAARNRAKELLGKEYLQATKAITRLTGIIKKAVILRGGLESLRDVPRCEYEVFLKQIETWNKPMEVFEIMEKARDELEAKAEKGQAETEAKGG